MGGGSGGGSGGGGGSTSIPAVEINEVATSDGDFFELLNVGTVAVDLSGFQVADRDDALNGPKTADAYTFPAGTMLSPGGYVLVVEGTVAGPTSSCDDATTQTCFAVTFGLSANNGDSVFLLTPSGAVARRVDVPARAHATFQSWGRLPNGTGAFEETDRTPAAANRRKTPDAGVDAGHDAGTLDAGIPDAGAPDAGSDPDAGSPVTFVVVRVGPAADGGNLSNASAAVQLEWRDLSTGSVLRTVPLPTSSSGGQHAFALSGSASSEGLLSSVGGRLSLAGYAIEPGVGSVNSQSGLARAVALIQADAGVDVSTALTDAYPGNNVRAATTSDGTGFWLAGTASMNAGVRYAGLGSTTSTEVLSTVTNIRSVKVVEGQLYASTASDAGAGTPRVFAVGSGLPMATAPFTPLAGVTVLNAGDFALVTRGSGSADQLYVANTSIGVGVHAFVRDTLGWRETPVLKLPASVACVGVAARVEPSGTVAVLCSGTNGSLYRWDDDGQATDGGPSARVLITAPAGTGFRGVAF